MARSMLAPWSKKLISSLAVTATANSATLTVPFSESYLFILDVTYTSGTTATLDSSLQISPDGGTTWYNSGNLFGQVTTASAVKALRIQPTMGRGEAASAFTPAATGSAAATNIPLPQTVRVAFTAGGTNPVYSVSLWAVTKPNQDSVD